MGSRNCTDAILKKNQKEKKNIIEGESEKIASPKQKKIPLQNLSVQIKKM